MKIYRKARVALVGTDPYLPDDRFEFPMTATVYFNGSAGVINTWIAESPDDQRVDRIFEATLTENQDGSATITGRSEYLDSMGLMPADQQVTISIKGGKPPAESK